MGNQLRYELLGGIKDPDLPGSLRFLADSFDDEDGEGEDAKSDLNEYSEEASHGAALLFLVAIIHYYIYG